ncbi:ERF family protein [Sphingomonas hankyongi]|uniref:ERF family protein n=1 Tax=Sphingomonas hankyongi TaxID=2908209 RepID=A0ABT0S2P0_9SPHN|nr:ERF family protein [Sphingomonas hankyongi]MCL6730134.1 ERF family protein [Sphingomonas hankyongi]
MPAPLIYSAIHAVAADLAEAGIPKAHFSPEGKYEYRSIDDVLGGLAPLLAQHRVCLLVHALERSSSAVSPSSTSMTSVAVKVAYTFVSVDDGSSHVVATYGEASDETDKATAKAMASAFKTAMVQTFCIPTGEAEADSRGARRPRAKLHGPQPEQGWQQWIIDIRDLLAGCESEEAVTLVQDRNRSLLTALSREHGDLYSEIGSDFSSRREYLRSKPAKPKVARARSSKRRSTPAPEALQNA